MTTNKFAGALRAIHDAQDSEAKASAPVPSTRRRTPPAKPEEGRGPGRPRGKRSNPDYRQITGLVPKAVHFEVVKALLEERGGRDMGELMTELFENWLKSQKR